MGRSKNDFNFYGSIVRVKANSPKTNEKPYEIRIYLVNPLTHKPYTYEEILDDLRKVSIDFPNLTPKCITVEKSLKQKNGKVYSRYIKGKDKVDAERKLKDFLLPDLACLAKILGRPQWVATTKNGSITIKELIEYVGDDLLVNISNVNERSHVKSALNCTLLPAIGNCPIADFSEPAKYASLVKSVKAKIKKDKKKSSSAHYARLAMNCLKNCVEQFGVGVAGRSEILKVIQVGAKKRQTALVNSQRPMHFSDSERETLFLKLYQGQELFILFWMTLIYAGMSVEEICAMRYADIEVIESVNGLLIYTCLVTGRRRKLTTDWRTVHVETDSFPIHRFRRVVLPPWATPILTAIMTFWQSEKREMNISSLSLSADRSGKTKNPDQVKELLAKSMERTGYSTAIDIQRTNKEGQAFLQTVPMNAAAALTTDAKYVAQEKCLFNDAMMHASFGMAATTVDETNYLDVLSYEFAIARYLRMRRYSPMAESDTLNGQANVIPAHAFVEYRLRNKNKNDARFRIDADFAILTEFSTEEEFKYEISG